MLDKLQVTLQGERRVGAGAVERRDKVSKP
jgi:hypothetical protein